MLNFDYDDKLPTLRRLIHLSEKSQWSINDIDWEKPLRRHSGDYEDILEWHGIFRYDYIQALTPKKREALGRSLVAFEFSQILHGEQGALMLAGQLTGSADDLDARLFAANQARDEARHVMAVRDLVQRIGPIFDCEENLHTNLEYLLGCNTWPKQVFGLQLFLEARALLSFRQTLLFVRDPVFQQVTRRIERDEANHVAFGIQYMRETLQDMDAEDRKELAQYARYLRENLWVMYGPEAQRPAFEEVDLDYDECYGRAATSFTAPSLSALRSASIETMHDRFSRWFERSIRRVGLEEALEDDENRVTAEEVAAEVDETKLPWIPDEERLPVNDDEPSDPESR